jgi:hypothetical protein
MSRLRSRVRDARRLRPVARWKASVFPSPDNLVVLRRHRTVGFTRRPTSIEDDIGAVDPVEVTRTGTRSLSGRRLHVAWPVGYYLAIIWVVLVLLVYSSQFLRS